MKKILHSFTLLFFFSFLSGCEEENLLPNAGTNQNNTNPTTTPTTTAKGCFMTSLKLEGDEFLKISIDKNNRPETVTINLDGNNPIPFKISYNNDGNISKVEADKMGTFEYVYNKTTLTKIQEKDGTTVTGEKLIEFASGKISKVTYNTKDQNGKAISVLYKFEYNKAGNLTKYILNSPDFGGKDLTIFEGDSYDSKSNQYAAFSNQIQPFSIAISDILFFLNPDVSASMLSANNCTAGKFKLALIDFLFGNLLGGLVGKDLNVAIPSIPFTAAFTFSDKGYPTKGTIKYKDGAKDESFASDFAYECK